MCEIVEYEKQTKEITKHLKYYIQLSISLSHFFVCTFVISTSSCVCVLFSFFTK